MAGFHPELYTVRKAAALLGTRAAEDNILDAVFLTRI